jgi:hypothetical protein
LASGAPQAESTTRQTLGFTFVVLLHDEIISTIPGAL